MATSEPSLSWEEPPKDERKPKKESKWAPTARLLQSRPGQWAKIVDNENVGVAALIRHGDIVAFRPPEAWEVRVQLTDGSRWTGHVWCRYVGVKQEHA